MAHYVTDKDGNLIEVAGNYTPEEIEMFLTAHPIGSYFISQYSISPAELYGGGWEEIDAGKTLWTIPTTETGAGEIIKAGLPNITGYFAGSMWFNQGGSSGALYGLTRKENSTIAVNSSSGNYAGMGINASRGETKLDGTIKNDVYGKSNTVQPPAVKVYMWRRYA